MDKSVEMFRNSLKYIMCEREVGIVQMAKEMAIAPASLRKLINISNDVKLKTLLKLADYFGCTLEFLCGRTYEEKEASRRICPEFGVRIKEITREYDVTPHALLSNSGITPSEYYYWIDGGTPMLISLDRMAHYLDITLDHLVGCGEHATLTPYFGSSIR